MMKIYEIVNMSNSNIYLEDINVKLIGKNSKATVSEDLYKNSKSVKLHSSALSIRVINTVNPIWPLSHKSTSKLPLITKEVKPAEGLTHNPSSDTLAESLQKNQMDALLSKMDLLIDTIRNKESDQRLTLSSVLSKSSSISSNVNSDQELMGHEEPMYIPSKIVPQSGTDNVVVKEESVDRADIDDVAKQLKKLKRKKNG